MLSVARQKIVLFSRGQVQTSHFNFNLGGEKIDVVDSYEYLGILFNYNGRFRKGELELLYVSAADKRCFLQISPKRIVSSV